jgi:hypothetical protein
MDFRFIIIFSVVNYIAWTFNYIIALVGEDSAKVDLSYENPTQFRGNCMFN